MESREREIYINAIINLVNQLGYKDVLRIYKLTQYLWRKHDIKGENK